MTDFRAIIVENFPELSNSQFKVLTHSWDSTAVDVDDALIFKFPKSPASEADLRKEAQILHFVQPRLTLPVPVMTIFHGPPLFTRHPKLKGDHLEHFETLSESAKDKLAMQMGRFYTQLHAFYLDQMKSLGATPLPHWADGDTIRNRCIELLPHALHDYIRHVCSAYAALAPDPYGDVYGFFDGHGWNMAFDRQSETLNGIYDFADSGFAPLHQEFVYASLTSPELADRILASYEECSNRSLDRQRVDILTGLHRLSELWGVCRDGDDMQSKINQVEVWANWTSSGRA